MEKVRLQKILQTVGHGPRRYADRLIQEGRVTLNGEVAVIGDKGTFLDSITVDGEPIDKPVSHPLQIALYCKADGEEVSHRSRSGYPTIFEALPNIHPRIWTPIGRLPVSVEGLQVVVSDGNVANALLEKFYRFSQSYIVYVTGRKFSETIPKLLSRNGEKGLDLIEPVSAGKAFRIEVSNAGADFVIELMKSKGIGIKRLKRLSYMGIEIPESSIPGEVRYLDSAQTTRLLRKFGIST